MARSRLAWRDMTHDDEALLEHEVRARSTQTKGPIAEFPAKKRAERAPRTAEWHQESLMQLWAFLDERGLTTVAAFNEHNVNLFRVHLRGRGVKDNTISNRLRSIKAFARWMGQVGWTQDNRLACLHVPQTQKPRFELIPDEVLQRLFALYQPETFLGARDLAILAVLAETGIRREEAARLLARNVDLDAQHIRVYSDKTEEWRYVPLTDEATAVIRNYTKWRDLYFRRPARVGNGRRTKQTRMIRGETLFLTFNGRELSPHALAEVLIRARRKLGYRIHPHLFRHVFATKKAIDGESPSVLKRWMGHRSYAMTDYYFGVAEEVLGMIKPKASVLAGVQVLPNMGPRRGRPRQSTKRRS